MNNSATLQSVYNPVKSGKSVTQKGTFTSLDELYKSFIEFNETFVLLWLYDAIYTGMLTKEGVKWLSEIPPNEKLTPPFTHLVQARIFDKNKECYIWRSAWELQYRFREDEPEEGKGDCFYVESTLSLRTVVATPLKNTINSAVIRVLTRNYIETDANGQAGYVDYRLVAFEK